MDDTELHYLTYDPEEIMQDMMLAYIEAGGDVLYPGDEKEMLLRAVLQIIAQAFAGIDNALRMDTLRYAVRDYLDVYGEKRNCARIRASAATAAASLTFAATGVAGTLSAGSAMTEDGSVLWTLDDDIAITGGEQTVLANITCATEGTAGNALQAGASLQMIVPVNGLTGLICVSSGAGGQDEETDDAYRERIRTYGLTTVTTGPAQQYEAVAMAVSSQIVSARALNAGAGQVAVYILPASETGVEALLARVAAALSADDVRPLTDSVTVARATEIPYTLNVQYATDGTSQIQTALAAAVSEYQDWQEGVIGRAFNPDKLAALLYQAGATRVIWGEGSSFDGGEVAYTEIAPSACCKGEISLGVIGA